MSQKVLVTGTSVADKFLSMLRDAGLEVSNPTHLLKESELRSELSDSVAYLLGGDEFASDTALSDAHALKIIAFLGVGYESFVDVAAATRRGIPVTNTPGVLTDSVAEFTVGQLLNARRRLTQYCNAYRRGEQGTETKQYQLAGHRIGIVGLGAIGTRIAEILRRGFQADISYFSRTQKPHEEERLGITMMPLRELASSCDAIVVMTPGNESTRGLIDSSVLGEMRPDALLINTARPDIVDASALKNGLGSNQPSIAVFDNFYEGDVGKELLSLYGEDRLLVTGHIGSLTHDARDAMATKTINSILNILSAGADENIVNDVNRSTSRTS
jgi:lactate dehydrogenase-like 2-hydroxyacid dehydrogenase